MKFQYRLSLLAVISLIMLICTIIFTLIVDTQNLSQNQDIIYVKVRDIYHLDINLESGLMYVAVSLSFLNTILGFYVFIKIYQLQKKRPEKNLMRTMLFHSAFYLTLGRFLEGLYLLLDSDYRAFKETVFQFYIVLDILALILLVAISFQIFVLEDDKESTSAAAKFHYLLGLFCFAIAYLFMNLFGIFPEIFAKSIFIAFGTLLLLAIVALTIYAKIRQVLHKVGDHRRALNLIGIQLLAFVVAILCLIGAGATYSLIESGAFLPNRILRVVRMISLLVVTLCYIPSFIKPGNKK